MALINEDLHCVEGVFKKYWSLSETPRKKYDQ